ncbi:hypothetical protein MiTe_02739 [Microcystis aeruginosa NIES-2520]|jgi:hypothetical protein|uniref:Uncharacterized protein n=1 Tax=Microcystis aeruginosa NIES-2520 TaxID=2303982 RepID=A0A5A5RRW6_MICAE|nr:hypothetical protein MiTe_02739 [Microcystis aeruginosa NIES-2520]
MDINSYQLSVISYQLSASEGKSASSQQAI